MFDDYTTRQHISYDWVMFNPVNGESVIESAAFSITTPPAIELADEDSGTLTLIFADAIKGLSFK